MKKWVRNLSFTLLLVALVCLVLFVFPTPAPSSPIVESSSVSLPLGSVPAFSSFERITSFVKGFFSEIPVPVSEVVTISSPMDEPLFSPSVLTPANQNVLCVYNRNSALSTQVCAYYLQKRPGARSLGVSIPDDAFAEYWRASKELLHVDTFYNLVINPVLAYTADKPEITHLAVAKDVPFLVWDPATGHGRDSAAGYLMMPYGSNQTPVAFYPGGLLSQPYTSLWVNPYANAGIHFNRELYRNSSGGYTLRFVASWLQGYTLEDIQHTIDKAVAPAQNRSEVTWLLDKDTDNFSVYEQDLAELTRDLLYRSVSSSRISVQSDNLVPLTSPTPVLGYYGPGYYHAGYPHTWVTESSLFSPTLAVANRSIYGTIESYAAFSAFGNASHFNMTDPAGIQSKIVDSFTARAFGGTAYSNSFAGAVGAVDEPGQAGLTFALRGLFRNYAQGLTFAESAAGIVNMRGPIIAFGDPLMRISDSLLKQPFGAFCSAGAECMSGLCEADINSTLRCVSREIIPGGSCLLPRAYDLTHYINATSYCQTSISTFTCLNGQTSTTTCPESTLCKQFTSALTQARCLLSHGERSLSPSLCYSNETGFDLFGNSRCVSASGRCSYGVSDIELNNATTMCLGRAHRFSCLNGNWSVPVVDCTCASSAAECVEQQRPPFLLSPSNYTFGDVQAVSFFVLANATHPLKSFFNVTRYSLTHTLFSINATSGQVTNSSSLSPGMYLLPIVLSDFFLNRNTTSVTVQISLPLDVMPPVIISPTPLSLIYGQSVGVTFSAQDNILVDTFSVNDSRFTISRNGLLTNKTALGAGIYTLNVSVNDSRNNINSTLYRVTINPLSSSVSLTLNGVASNVSIVSGQGTLLSASRIKGESTMSLRVDGLEVNNSASLILNRINITVLGNHSVNVSHASTQNYSANSTVVYIEVREGVDVVSPFFTSIPANVILDYGSSVTAVFSASDNRGNVNYFVNDSRFNISQSGLLTNKTALGAGIYNINVSVNDSRNNINSTLYRVTINPISSSVSLTLNGVASNVSIVSGQGTLLSASRMKGESTMSLRVDGLEVNNSASLILNRLNLTVLGNHSVNVSHASTQNYSANSTVVYIEVRGALDSTPPQVILVSPASGTLTRAARVWFAANFSDGIALTNATLRIWNSTNSLINITSRTITGTSNFTNISVTLPAQGNYSWNYLALDSNNNLAFNHSNFSIQYSFDCVPGATLACPVLVDARLVNGVNNACDAQGRWTNVSTCQYMRQGVVFLSNLTHTYAGTSHRALVSTEPVGLQANVTYNGRSALPVAGGNYTVVATILNESYEGNVTGRLEIRPALQSLQVPDFGIHRVFDERVITGITSAGFAPMFEVVSGGETFEVVTGDSLLTGNVISPLETRTGLLLRAWDWVKRYFDFAEQNTFTPSLSPSTLSNGTRIRFIQPGNLTLRAVHAGNENYSSALPIERTIQVRPAFKTVQLGEWANQNDFINLNATHSLEVNIIRNETIGYLNDMIEFQLYVAGVKKEGYTYRSISVFEGKGDLFIVEFGNYDRYIVEYIGASDAISSLKQVKLIYSPHTVQLGEWAGLYDLIQINSSYSVVPVLIANASEGFKNDHISLNKYFNGINQHTGPGTDTFSEGKVLVNDGFLASGQLYLLEYLGNSTIPMTGLQVRLTYLSPFACSDSDSGLDYSIRGVLTAGNVGSSVDLEDYCSDASHLKEYFCDSNRPTSFENIACPNGCVNGSCVDMPCTSFNYSSWGACNSSGQQTRIVIGPASCSNVTPILNQSCTYVPPICEPNSIISCDEVAHSTFTGYKRSCNALGTSYVANNTCSYTCHTGFVNTGTLTSPLCVQSTTCTPGATTACAPLAHASVTGYANTCNALGTGFITTNGTVENTCVYRCDPHYHSNETACVSRSSAFARPTLRLIREPEGLFVFPNETNTSYIVFGSTFEETRLGNLSVTIEQEDEREAFVIVRNVSLRGDEVKTIILKTKRTRSNAVCIADRSDIVNHSDIERRCFVLACPGVNGSYTCEKLDDRFLISGLRHSGVIETRIVQVTNDTFVALPPSSPSPLFSSNRTSWATTPNFNASGVAPYTPSIISADSNSSYTPPRAPQQSAIERLADTIAGGNQTLLFIEIGSFVFIVLLLIIVLVAWQHFARQQSGS